LNNKETEKFKNEMDEYLKEKYGIADAIFRQALIESTIKFAEEEFERHLRGTGAAVPKGILGVEIPTVLIKGATLISRSCYKALYGDAPPAPGVFVVDDEVFENKTPSELNSLLRELARSAKKE